ncbi:hypothetical protein [Maribacter arenosus]|uniref:Uncharacterized protein n=1 Tax=Maribacter arenosus TaxID=1854708 RepID=A0ABR7VBZ5_9FLAO|nr:hypothetical protein [Maribacter arenosus]MBD0850878.1 hypothetical protein [Maribacter arenosus]
MKKIVPFIILISISVSCDKKEITCCTTIDFGLDILIVNADGVNILDKVDGIASKDIRLFYRTDSEWIEHFGYDQRNAKGMTVEEINGENRLRVLLTPDYNNPDYDTRGFTEIKIQFSESDFDIIKGEIDFSNGHVICTKIWCNDVLKWEAYTSDRLITLIK